MCCQRHPAGNRSRYDAERGGEHVQPLVRLDAREADDHRRPVLGGATCRSGDPRAPHQSRSARSRSARAGGRDCASRRGRGRHRARWPGPHAVPPGARAPAAARAGSLQARRGELLHPVRVDEQPADPPGPRSGTKAAAAAPCPIAASKTVSRAQRLRRPADEARVVDERSSTPPRRSAARSPPTAR